MKLRGDNISTLERSIRETRERIEQDEGERRQHAELAAQAEQEKRGAAQDPAAFDEAAAKLARHRNGAERLGYVLEQRSKDLAELERRLEHARFANAYETLSATAERRHAAAAKLTAVIVSATKALTARDAAHDEFTPALAHARELCPDDIEFELPESADEPEFPAAVDRLVEALQAGPRRPLAKSAAASERVHRQGEAADASVGGQTAREALVHNDFTRLARLTPKQRRAAVPAAEQLARTLPQNERDAEIVERRLERLRELVAEAEQAMPRPAYELEPANFAVSGV